MKFHRYLLKIRLPKRSRYSPFFDLILRQSTVNFWNTHCVSSLNTAGLRRSFRQDPSWIILRSVSSTNTWREMRNLLWSTFGHQLNGVRSVHQRSFLQLSHGPAYFMEPTQFLHHPWPIWVLAGFYFMSSNVMTSNNDCYFIPTVGMLGASKIAILIWIAISGVRTEDSASVP